MQAHGWQGLAPQHSRRFDLLLEIGLHLADHCNVVAPDEVYAHLFLVHRLACTRVDVLDAVAQDQVDALVKGLKRAAECAPVVRHEHHRFVD